MALNYGLSPQALESINYGRTNPVGGATAYNLGSGDNLSSISELVNSLTRQGQSAALGARIPNAPALEAESSANINSELQGQLPADVLTQLRQQAAERGVATGSPGSPNSNAAYLRALGLTSLDLTRTGQQELTAAEGRNPAAPIFDPTTQLLTPYQAGTLGLEQQRQQDELLLNRQRLAQQVALGGRGGGGGGGQPAPAPDAYVRQAPFGYGIPETVGLSPYAGMSSFTPYTSTGDYGYGVPQGHGTTSFTYPPMTDQEFQDLFAGFPGGAPDTGGGQYPLAPDQAQSVDQSGGPGGQ